MRKGRSLLSPIMVMAVALVTGGWFLQQGVSQEENIYLQVRLFQEVVDHVTDRFVDPVDRSKLYDSAIDGVLKELDDPHTSFIDAATWESFRFRSGADSEYGGVGLEILARENAITVMNPIPGGPAIRAGIHTGDRIVEIGGQSAREWSTDDAADQLRGVPGTTIDVVIERPGVVDPIPFTLVRAVIEIRSVPFASMLEGGIGYIPLQLFSETSAREVGEALDSLVEIGLEGLILDLRQNPGGLLDQGVAIADLFLDEGVGIVETRGRAQGQNESFNSVRPQRFPALPLVVLVNESSASAAEIVAGALQDHDRALVLGARSFGKGSVQTLYRLSGGNVLRLTTARWFTPSGRSIQKPHEEQQALRAGEGAAMGLAGGSVALPDTEGQPTFDSMGGRTIFGGGGITPDLAVIPDTLSPREADAVLTLYRQAGILSAEVFNYAVAYVQAHPALTPGFDLPSGDLQEFYARTKKAGLETNRDTFAQAQRFIRFQLEREIALQAWGPGGRFEQTRDSDLQLFEAAELLRSAEGPLSLFRAAELVEEPKGFALSSGSEALATSGGLDGE
ncbi:MAG: S41 family peptidase [Gemmatimonadota bacterium]|nr:MAG: S41 family peptidase [Gemmatimonadota bacterium]